MKIRNYIKVNGEFIPLKQFKSIVPDEDYIDGAIEIEWKGRLILSKEYWDCVDELWNYFFDSLVVVNKGKVASTHWPDTPVLVTFTPIGNQMVRFAIIGEKTKPAYIPRKIFFSEMLAAFTEFVEYIPTISPKSRGWSDYMKSELKKSGLK